MGCVFCSIVAGELPATIYYENHWLMAIKPLKPQVKAHALWIPKVHVDDFTTNPALSGTMMRFISDYYINEPYINLITSKGSKATQTVFHLHIHALPRSSSIKQVPAHWPWTNLD